MITPTQKNLSISVLIGASLLFVDLITGMSDITINVVCAGIGIPLFFLTAIFSMGQNGVIGVFSSKDMDKIIAAHMSNSGVTLTIISVSLIAFSFLSFMYKVNFNV